MSKEKWTEVRVGKNSTLLNKPIGEDIIEKMPPEGSKPIINHSIADIARRDVKRLLGLDK